MLIWHLKFREGEIIRGLTFLSRDENKLFGVRTLAQRKIFGVREICSNTIMAWTLIERKRTSINAFCESRGILFLGCSEACSMTASLSLTVYTGSIIYVWYLYIQNGLLGVFESLVRLFGS